MTRSPIAIVGPTATGKTQLAIEISRRLGGEVVSVDSRQAYRGMAIGTASPTAGELAAVPHHGVCFLPIESRYSAGEFARRARGWIADIESRGGVPLLVGGTGFFLRALLSPVFREPPMDRARRDGLRDWLRGVPRGLVRRWALILDPALGRRLETLDWQRAARTIELAWLSGRPLSWWQEHGEPEAEPVSARVYALQLAPEDHRQRIRTRLEACWDAWVDEVRALLEAGTGPADTPAPGWSAVGYRELAAWLASERDAPATEVMLTIERATWQYARRQRTWFRHQLPESTVWLDARLPTGQLADRIEEASSRAGAPTPP